MFVPINTIAYARVKAHDRNSASALISIARNMGGSIGIGITSTLVTRGSQSHRAALIEHLTPTDPAYTDAVDALAQGVRAFDPDPAHAELVAQALISQSVDRHAAMISYVGQFAALSLAFLLLCPVVLAMRPPARIERAPLPVE